jgi:hypothetical protein
VPWRLQPFGGLVRAQADLRKDLLRAQARLANALDERGGIGPVGSRPVGDRDVRRRREGDQEAFRRLHQREAGGERLARRRERKLAAHVGDDDPHPARRGGEGAGDVGEAEPFERHVDIARDPRVDGHEVVLALELDAVAGDIHHDRSVRLGRLDLVEEVAHDPAQLVRAEVATLHDLEAGAHQHLRDQARIVHGGRQLPGLVSPLPDHQRDALLRCRPARNPGAGHEKNRDENSYALQTNHGRASCGRTAGPKPTQGPRD